jgi:hypothetical protein
MIDRRSHVTCTEQHDATTPDSAALKLEALERAIEHRTVIGIALGIIMAGLHVDRDGAFAYLSRVSTTQHRKLYVIAAEVADSGQLPVVAGGRPVFGRSRTA